MTAHLATIKNRRRHIAHDKSQLPSQAVRAHCYLIGVHTIGQFQYLFGRITLDSNLTVKTNPWLASAALAAANIDSSRSVFRLNRARPPPDRR